MMSRQDDDSGRSRQRLELRQRLHQHMAEILREGLTPRSTALSLGQILTSVDHLDDYEREVVAERLFQDKRRLHLVTLQQAAHYFECSERTLIRDAKKYPKFGWKVGKCWVFNIFKAPPGRLKKRK